MFDTDSTRNMSLPVHLVSQCLHLLALSSQKEEWKAKEAQLVKARNDEIKKSLMIQQECDSEKQRSSGLEAELRKTKAELAALTEETRRLKAIYESSQLAVQWDERAGSGLAKKENDDRIALLESKLASSETKVISLEGQVIELEAMVTTAEHLYNEEQEERLRLDRRLREMESGVNTAQGKSLTSGEACAECAKHTCEIERLQV